ncbi:MAG: DUF4126 family protein [Thermomicrobiales bacterium]
MDETTTNYVDAAILGTVAGLRSQLPLALLVLAARRNPALADALPAPLRHPMAPAVLTASAIGEIVVDKLPFTPSRLQPGSLIVRSGLGGLAGALLLRSRNESTRAGAIIGAAWALAGSFAGYYVRTGIVRKTHLPDPLVAVAEDGAGIALGLHAVLANQPPA